MEHLIPQEWFEPLPQILLLLIAAASIGALGKGADWLVEGAAFSARRLGLPKIIVGATIVSLGTTSPEFAVSVMAAWTGEAGLALGNAVGSIIADTGLIFGLGCLLTRLPANRFVLSRQGWMQFGSAVLLAVICYGSWMTAGDDAAIGRPIGLLFLGLLAVYLVLSVRWSRQQARVSAAEAVSDVVEEETEEFTVPRAVVQIVAGLAAVIVFSHVLICAVSVLAERWGVPQVVIAGSLVALGTSLPELVIGMSSLRKGHKEILVGNVIGADVLNVLFVIGGSAAAARLPIIEVGSAVPEIFLYLHLPAMLVILVLFRIFIAHAVRKGEFSRWMGVPLLVLYVLFVAAPYLMARE